MSMAAITPEEIRELLVEEVDQLCGELARGLVSLDARPEALPLVIDDLFRAAHSLRGACQVAGMEPVALLGDGLESVFAAVRSGALRPDHGLCTVLLAVVVALDGVVSRLRRGLRPDMGAVARSRVLLSGLRADADPYRMAPTGSDRVPVSPSTVGSGA